MSTNLLLLNSDKTEVIVFDPKHLRNRLVDFTMASRSIVRNLGVILDQDMSCKHHRLPFLTSTITIIAKIGSIS